MELKNSQEKWKELLEKVNENLELLKSYTEKLENADKLSPSEFTKINSECKKTRQEIDVCLEEMKSIAERSGRFFTEDQALARLYNEFHERMRNVHEVTLQVVKALKDRMVNIEDEINMLRKKKHAISMYRSHEMFSSRQGG